MALEAIRNYLEPESGLVWQDRHWKTDWTLLQEKDAYAWVMGVTPFSQPIIPFVALILYFIVIFGLQAIMKKRSAWNTRKISAVHNLILAIWSLAMCVGSGYYGIMKAINRGTWVQMVCELSNAPSDGPLYFVGYWYYLSKYYELLDTVILVLRKRPLTVLHVYHHSIVILLTYLWVVSDYSLCWWAVWLNTMVHVFMYTYFFLVSLSVRIPNFLKKMLTKGQIFQFCIFGVVGILNVYFTLQGLEMNLFDTFAAMNGDIGSTVHFDISYTHGCKGSLWILMFSIFVNISILVLFLNFFKQNYTKKGGKKRIPPQKNSKRKNK